MSNCVILEKFVNFALWHFVGDKKEFFMGLDAVEVILAIEEDFGLEIDDEDVFSLETVIDMVDYIYFKLKKRRKEKHWCPDLAKKEFLNAVSRSVGEHSLSEIKMTSFLSELFSYVTRRTRWEELRVELGAGKHSWPSLVRPKKLLAAIFATILIALFVGIYNFPSILIWFADLFLFIFLMVITMPLRRQFPKKMKTINDLFDNYYRPYRHGYVSYETVKIRIKEIIVEQLGVAPSDVTDYANFIEDLGMD